MLLYTTKQLIPYGSEKSISPCIFFFLLWISIPLPFVSLSLLLLLIFSFSLILINTAALLALCLLLLSLPPPPPQPPFVHSHYFSIRSPLKQCVTCMKVQKQLKSQCVIISALPYALLEPFRLYNSSVSTQSVGVRV